MLHISLEQVTYLLSQEKIVLWKYKPCIIIKCHKTFRIHIGLVHKESIISFYLSQMCVNGYMKQKIGKPKGTLNNHVCCKASFGTDAINQVLM